MLCVHVKNGQTSSLSHIATKLLWLFRLIYPPRHHRGDRAARERDASSACSGNSRGRNRMRSGRARNRRRWRKRSTATNTSTIERRVTLPMAALFSFSTSPRFGSVSSIPGRRHSVFLRTPSIFQTSLECCVNQIFCAFNRELPTRSRSEDIQYRKHAPVSSTLSCSGRARQPLQSFLFAALVRGMSLYAESPRVCRERSSGINSSIERWG